MWITEIALNSRGISPWKHAEVIFKIQKNKLIFKKFPKYAKLAKIFRHIIALSNQKQMLRAVTRNKTKQSSLSSDNKFCFNEFKYQYKVNITIKNTNTKTDHSRVPVFSLKAT